MGTARRVTAESAPGRAARNVLQTVVLAIGALLVIGGLVTVALSIGPSGAGSSKDEGAGGKLAAISAAPAFSPAELSSPQKDSWATNGGSTMNQRYSPLDQIDASNVSKLKGVWLTHLRKSATAARYSAESQPIVYDGTAYISTGADDVFAVDVDTGKIRWQYKANLPDDITSVCCGWGNRGVAIGDGRVYIGQLDGTLVALDQRTGHKDWSRAIESWKHGYTITSAPLYYDGRVYTGISGGEFEARGRLTAVDAATGKIDWRFYTVPGPGQVGHDTWPQHNDAWKHGGAPIWQTPAVDPKLGLLYFSTGNASPDDNGHARPGDNLFASSIVAIDAKTGRHRWHFQLVHHDIWDYDAPSPVVLFDVKVGGKLHHALGEASKTGWTYMLDRTNGRPLHGISERPVPQNAYQRTAKTQPFPSTPPVVSHTVSDKQFAEIRTLGHKSPQTKKLPAVRGPLFSPLEPGQMTVVAPSPAGGTNWPPSSYNARTQMLYVCSLETAGGYSVNITHRPRERGQAPYLASIWTLTGFTPNPGALSAIDTRTGRIVWQKHWKDACYSGSTTTAGNLVFVGRNHGELQAYDARTGAQRWSFQTGAGANDTPTVFQRNGKEYVLFYAGGNGLAATQHGDNLWLFGLDGKLGPVKAGGLGQGVQHAGENTTDAVKAKGDAAAGKTVFTGNCSSCHGISGHGGNGGPDLTTRPGAKINARIISQVQKGGGGMPGFETTLTPKQIADVAAYVLSVTKGK
jgi:quinohemoprotein ethanol dehydrogenase